MRFWAGLNTAEPLTPSLNQILNCNPGWVNNAAGIGPMFGCVVSPKAAVNKPLLTATFTAAVGSLPLALVPSLLQ